MSAAATIAAIAGAVGTGYSIYSGERAAQEGRDARRQARNNMVKQERAADEATNRANQKRAGISDALRAATTAGKSGVGSTMLTGPSGVDIAPAVLGKTSLLGG